MIDLRKRHLLTLLDFTPEEITYLLDLAAQLKTDKYLRCEKQMLTGKNIVLLFEKDSTRTRCSFEVAAHDQGAHVTYLGPTGSQIGKKESIKDTAHVLGRMYDGIEYRGYAQRIVQLLAEFSGVPVWNGLTTEFHPTQALADMLTMREHCSKPFSEIKFCFLGDAHNNVANSLMVMAAKMGMDFRAISPRACAPDPSLVERCRQVLIRSTVRLWRRRAIPIASLCTVCRPSTTWRPKWATISTKNLDCARWRSLMRCSNQRLRLSLTRLRTGCTRSKR